MASLRTIRRRIASVKNTQKITRAMKMVSAAKLRRSQDRLMAARPYARKMAEVINRLAQRATPESHPLLVPRGGNKSEIVVVTSDKGLCGSFNSNVLRQANSLLREQSDSQTSLTLIGKKGRDFFRRRKAPIRREFIDLFRVLSYPAAADIGKEILKDYLEGEVDRITLIFNEFKSTLQQRVVVQPLLPISPEIPTREDLTDYLYEPSADQVIDELLKKYVEVRVYHALLESLVGEHASRMTAMDAATDNAEDMIVQLTLTFNKARQAAITKELIEVVSGADALKG